MRERPGWTGIAVPSDPQRRDERFAVMAIGGSAMRSFFLMMARGQFAITDIGVFDRTVTSVGHRFVPMNHRTQPIERPSHCGSLYIASKIGYLARHRPGPAHHPISRLQSNRMANAFVPPLIRGKWIECRSTLSFGPLGKSSYDAGRERARRAAVSRCHPTEYDM